MSNGSGARRAGAGSGRRCFRRGMSVVVTAAVITLGAPKAQPAHADLADAGFPSISGGMDGQLVTAWQWILRYHGYRATNPTGNFDSATLTQTVNLQDDFSLDEDGVVDSAVWSAALPNVNQGASGHHVRALETLLNEKDASHNSNPNVTFPVGVDGTFSTSNSNYLKIFQGDVGLSQTGNADLTTWKYLTWHFVPTYTTGAFGVESCTVGTPTDHPHDGGGENHMDPWMTESVKADFTEAVTAFWGIRQFFGQGAINWWGIAITDVSRAHGDESEPHLTHREGMDLDIRPFRTDGSQCVTATSSIFSGSHNHTSSTNFIAAYNDTAQWWANYWIEYHASDDGTLPFPYLERVIFNDWRLESDFPHMVVDGNHKHDNHQHTNYCTISDPALSSTYTCG